MKIPTGRDKRREDDDDDVADAKTSRRWRRAEDDQSRTQNNKTKRRTHHGSEGKAFLGEELWSSGHGRRLMFERSCVQIPVPYT